MSIFLLGLFEKRLSADYKRIKMSSFVSRGACFLAILEFVHV
jgi:hypothetical protein